MDLTQMLYSVESGAKGPNLIFVPGLAGTTRYWQGHLAALEQRYHFVRVDPLGFGQSSKPWTRYTVERHIGALYRTLSKHAPFTLVGHSMGAVLSIAYAARYPDQVERLILFSLPYFGSKEQTYQHFRNGPFLDRWFLTNMGLAALACMITRRVFGRILPYLLRDLPREVVEDIAKHTWRSFTSSLWEVIYNHNLERDADALDSRLPVFCFHGDQDRTAPLAGVRKLASGRPNWEVHILAGADHHPFLRMPDDCVRAVESALAPKRSVSGFDVHIRTVTVQTSVVSKRNILSESKNEQ
jgi:pimeloyl-ACP methyl ester carboxylesterase